MKYIVELRTSRRYEEVEADSPMEAVMAVKKNPDFKHTHTEESAEVYLNEPGQQHATVLNVFTPRRYDGMEPSSMGMNTASGRIA